MKKHPFLIFAASIGLLIAGIVWFIQGPQFAQIVKSVAADYLPSDLGLDMDFVDFSVRLFPPGVSINRPSLVAKAKNLLGLPPGFQVSAERINLRFRPVQMFSRKILIHEVQVINGSVRVRLDLEKAEKTKSVSTSSRRPFEIHWDELFQIHAESIALENTRIDFMSARPAISATALAHSIRLSQWSGLGGLGYELKLDLRNTEAHGEYFRTWPLDPSFEQALVSARVNAAGLEFDTLSLRTAGLSIASAGTIRGNLLKPEGLIAEAKLKLDSDIRELSRLFRNQVGESFKDANGLISFFGRVSGNLDDLKNTLKAEGSLSGRRVTFQKWKADELNVEGSWKASSVGGELSVAKGFISAIERPRVGGHQAGQGGRIEIGAFHFTPGGRRGLSIPLRLDRAHIHWLAAPGLKDVYPLDFRVSGPLVLNFGPDFQRSQWSIDAQLNLNIEQLILDNQRLGKTKPLHRILKVSKIRLQGSTRVDAKGIHPAGLTLHLPRSRVLVGGTIDFKTGYDLTAGGSVNLEDFGELAENKIRGEGQLSAHVHGTSARVLIDFDADLRNAYYIHLHLGELKGRVTWDDDPQDLIFRDVTLTQGRTKYVTHGKLALGSSNAANLEVQFDQGDARDLIHIFRELTADLWWFPQSLTGEFNGNLIVRGPIDLDQVDILGRLKGTNWNYMEERFKKVWLTGGYKAGKYHIDEFKAMKGAGFLGGNISFDRERRFDWDFSATNLSVTDFDHIARLEIPTRGRVHIASYGKGTKESLVSDTQLSLLDFSIRGNPLPPSQLSLKTNEGTLYLNGIALGGQGLVDVKYQFKAGAPGVFRGQLRHLDFTPVLLLLNSKSSQDKALGGFVSGSVDLGFRSGASELSTGKVEISEYSLAKTGMRFSLAQPMSFNISDGTFDVKNLRLKGNEGETLVFISADRGVLEGTIKGSLDVGISEFFTSVVEKAAGTANLDFVVGGNLKSPTISGRAEVNSAMIRAASIESPFENVVGTLQLRQNILLLRRINGDLAGGHVSAEGTMELFADRYPRISMRGNLSGCKLKVFPFQFARTTGAIRLTGAEPPYLVEGTLAIDSALSREKVLKKNQRESLKSVQYAPVPASARDADYPTFKLKLDIQADHGVLVQNDLFDAELRAHFTILNTIETPQILGAAEVIQGKMIFKDRTFLIQSASASFNSPTVINPSFNLSASTDVNGVRINLYASGKMDQMKVDLSSSPTLPETDIISLLALGVTSSEAKKLGSSERSIYEQGEAVSLLLNSLDFNREVKNKTGLQIQLDESVNSRIGTNVLTPQTQSDLGTAPKIVIKKQINNRLGLSLGSTVGVGQTIQQEVNAEYSLTSGVSVLGIWNNLGTVGNPDYRNSFGLDLKLQKGFR